MRRAVGQTEAQQLLPRDGIAEDPGELKDRHPDHLTASRSVASLWSTQLPRCAELAGSLLG